MPEEKQRNPSFVEVSSIRDRASRCYALPLVCRAALPYGHHHLGVYAYTRESLAAFAASPPHPLESQERAGAIALLDAWLSSRRCPGELTCPRSKHRGRPDRCSQVRRSQQNKLCHE